MPDFDFTGGAEKQRTDGTATSKQKKIEEAAASLPVIEISINAILVQEQVRKEFDPEQIQDLIVSIKKFGQLQPLLVQSHPQGKYLLCSGERRLRAMQELNIDKVQVKVLDPSNDFELVQLHENIMRADLDPLEEAEAFQKIMEAEKISTKNKLAEYLGIPKSRVYRRLELVSGGNDLLDDEQAQKDKESKKTKKDIKQYRSALLTLSDEFVVGLSELSENYPALFKSNFVDFLRDNKRK